MVLCAGAFGCYAAQGSLPGAQGQGYDLNLSYSRTTLKAVADAITQQVGIAFSYETALAGYPMENLEVSEKGATIEAILAAVFTPRGIDYRVVDKVVVLTRSTRPVPAASAAAKSEVKGVVRDAAGNPMIGVTVTIKGTLVGVSTGVDGGYAIPADGNATLLFSYIGYRPHEEVVGRRTQIDVTMQEDELVMDEVVVVGYGTLKKRNIVGAVENLSGDAVENRPNANITRSLQGQIPGLNIVQVDGKADHAGEVTIRGVNNTFKARVSGGEKTNKLGQGGGALVLIDGAEGDMGSVNPDDIASISVRQGRFVGRSIRRPRRIRRDSHHDQGSREGQGARELQRLRVAAPPYGDLGGQRGHRPRAVGRCLPRVVSQLLADGDRTVALQ